LNEILTVETRSANSRDEAAKYAHAGLLPILPERIVLKTRVSSNRARSSGYLREQYPEVYESGHKNAVDDPRSMNPRK
jgi:hypothetical protein